MKRRVVAAAVALLLATTAWPARAEWTLMESEHFALYLDREQAFGRELLQQLEVFRWLGLKVLGANEASLRAQARFNIYVLAGRQELQKVFPGITGSTAGLYARCYEGAAAYAVEDGMAGEHAISLGQFVVQHEYAHHLMFQYATVTYPAWYVEGFAEYMGVAVLNSETLSLGAFNPWRMETLESSWLPMEEVLTGHKWVSGRRGESDTASFYAQSWLLTHYLLSADETARKLPAYFDRIGAGEEPVAAFEAVFGIPVADLQQLLVRYKKRLMVTNLHGAAFPKPVIKATPLGPDADDYLAQASVLKVCAASSEHGEALLTKLRKLAPKPDQASPGLRLALAWAESRFGDVKVAINLLDAHLAADPNNTEAHYLLGRAWTRQAEALSGDERSAAQEQVRSHLLQAYRLNKTDAPTLYFLAQALAKDGVNTNVLNAARAARMLAPSVAEYALFEAQLDLDAGERDRAVRALGPLASNTHNLQQADRTRQAIAAIQAGKSTAEVMALLNPQTTKP